jgi:uncharacterized protein
MLDWIGRPWPWWVAGPAVGLMVPLLLLIGGKQFGVSSNLRHLCAALLPSKAELLRYDWRREGWWNLTFALGIAVGAWIAATWLGGVGSLELGPATLARLARLGLAAPTSALPGEIFSWAALASWPGLVIMVGGGFLIGFGSRYAGGCTSGHAISGLADLQLPSLLAVVGFFAGGLLSAHFVLPLLLP